MKSFALALVAAAFSSSAISAPPENTKPAVKVLFVGNSQMMSYDLPEMIRLMSESAPAGSARIAPGRALKGGFRQKGVQAGQLGLKLRRPGMVIGDHPDRFRFHASGGCCGKHLVRLLVRVI